MTTEDQPQLPQRMRDYRIEADLRESPDLHKLTQMFITMARNRAAAEKASYTTIEQAAPPGGQQVES